MKMRIYLFLFAVIAFTACTSTKEVSTTTTETEILQAITVPVPEVKGQIELKPLKDNFFIETPQINDEGFKGESFNPNDEGFYGEKEIQIDKDRKATVKIKVSKSNNKPSLVADVSIKQDSIKTEARVIRNSRTTETHKETKIESPFKWVACALFALVALVVALYLFKPSIFRR